MCKTSFFLRTHIIRQVVTQKLFMNRCVPVPPCVFLFLLKQLKVWREFQVLHFHLRADLKEAMEMNKSGKNNTGPSNRLCNILKNKIRCSLRNVMNSLMRLEALKTIKCTADNHDGWQQGLISLEERYLYTCTAHFGHCCMTFLYSGRIIFHQSPSNCVVLEYSNMFMVVHI